MTRHTAPEAFLALGTATLSDALDRLGLQSVCLGIAPLSPAFTLAGPARTVRYAPCGREKGTVGDYIDDFAAGTVVVLDNAGRVDCTVWGDILTECAAAKGIGGTVIDGVCRDSALCRTLDYPVFSRGAFMRTGKDRVQVEQYDGPVSIGRARVMPHDLLVGDADGVVVIEDSAADQVFEVATEIGEREDAIREAVRLGAPLRQARERFDYHHLQSRSTT